jgi:hypothetical protein
MISVVAAMSPWGLEPRRSPTLCQRVSVDRPHGIGD